MSPIKRLLNKTLRKSGDRITILSFSAHEGMQSNLADVNADFFCFEGGGLLEWKLHQRPLPKNMRTIRVPEPNNLIRFIPPDIQPHAIFSHNFMAHGQQCLELSRQLQIPLLSIQHCWPMTQDTNFLRQCKQFRPHQQIFISSASRQAWGWDENEAIVIRHGLDTKTFCPNPTKRESINRVLSVANEFITRGVELGYSLWAETVKGLDVKVLGKTPGLSEPTKSREDLLDHYQSYSVFFNSSQISPIPLSLLEAMSCGMACVTTPTCAIPEICTNGHDCLMGETPAQLRKHLDFLLNNPEERKRLGDNARQTILEKHSLERYTKDWDQILQDTVERYS